MKKMSMGVGGKIGGGFGTVLVLLIVLVGLTYLGVNNIENDAAAVIMGNKLDADLAQREVDHLKWAEALSRLLTDDKVTKLTVQVDPHKCAFGRWLYGPGRKEAEARIPSLAPLFKALEDPHARLHESAAAIGEMYTPADQALGNFLRDKKADHLQWGNRILDAVVNPSSRELKGVQLDPAKCGLGRWLYNNNIEAMKKKDPEFAKAVDKIYGPHTKVHQSARKIARLLKAGEHDRALQVYLKETRPLIDQVLRGVEGVLAWNEDRISGMQAAMSTYAEDTIPALHEVQSGLLDLRREVKKHVISDESMLATAGRLKLTVAAMGLAALLLGALLALIITRGITRPLKAAMIEVRSVADGDFTFTVGADYLDRGDELGEMIRDVRDMNLHLADTVRQVVQSADVVSSSSSEITRGNQDLSERTQRQAEAIEETASAMQELTAGVKQNASNSQEASRLAQEAAKTASQGGAVVEETEEAMAAVSESSNKISEITNVVNEIAFQTNLLALNAAVEAARAGEAGRGFAVVAGEVRNLAGRSAGAAKEIQKLISDSVEKVEQGNELVARSGKLLSDVISHVQHVADTVSEVTAASQEQAQGIEEVNQAVSQMDSAVQQNAALVEEAAAASEEMASAAEKLRGLMGQFKLEEAVEGDEAEAPGEADGGYGEPF